METARRIARALDHEPVPGAPDFELYDERFDGETGTGEVDLYVPIV